jgi:hypothetical protein
MMKNFNAFFADGNGICKRIVESSPARERLAFPGKIQPSQYRVESD